MFVSPFDSQSEMKTFLNKIEERKIDEAAQAKSTKEKTQVHRVALDLPEELSQTVQAVYEAGRTPLIVSSLQYPVDSLDLLNRSGLSTD